MNKITTRRRTIIKRRITTILTLLIIASVLMLMSYVDTRYHRDAVVDSVTETTTTFIDTCGHEWEYSALDVAVGQKVKLKMHTSHTDSDISDDVILDVKAVAIK